MDTKSITDFLNTDDLLLTFKRNVEDKGNKLHCLLPACNPRTRNVRFRDHRRFRPIFKTNRFRDIIFNALKA